MNTSKISKIKFGNVTSNLLNQSIYNSKDVNEQLLSTSNLLIQNTSFLSKSYNTSPSIQIKKKKMKPLFLKPKTNSRNVLKYNNKVLSYSSNLMNPKESDREKLSTYYKLTDDIDKEEDLTNTISTTRENKPENREQKLLFSRYNISYDNSISLTQLPKINESNISCNFQSTYFNSSNKAKRTIETNKQLADRMNEITNYFLVQKYKKEIENLEKKKYFLKKMPKILIKNIDEKNEIIDTNIFESNNTRTDSKGISKISMNIFKKVSFNGMLAVNNIDMKKFSRKIIHEVNAIITYISPAFKPYSRTDFSINVYKNYAYLFGGLSSGYLNDIWEYDLLKNKWTKILFKKDNEIPIPRYNHTMNIVNKYLVIFGGFTPKNADKIPEQLILFDLEEKNFIYPKITKRPGFIQRKGHISISTTNTMLIYGGMDVENGEILNSAYLLDLNKYEFEKFHYYGIKLPYLMNHNAVLVNNFHIYTTKPYSFYKIPENDIPNTGKNIINGVYIFGGQNERGDLKNDMYIIVIGTKPCKVYKPKIDGIPPEPRMSCGMEFILSYDFIIIHGGTGLDSRVLNDIMILNTESFNWIRPIFDFSGEGSPKELISRTEHEIFFYRGRIYILGGRDLENYLKMNFECVQFEITNF